MNEMKWADEMQSIRNNRIDIADKQVLDKFTRSAPALYSTRKPIKVLGNIQQPARKSPWNVRIVSSILAGFLLLGLLIDLALFCHYLPPSSSPNPLSANSGQAKIFIHKEQPVIILNATIQAGNQQDCTAIQWKEGSTIKIKYECEVKP